MEKITVLMTGAGAPGMPGILHCLRYANDPRLRLIGADMNPYASCRHQFERFYTIPPAKGERFIDSIIDICNSEKIDLVVSCVTRELNVLSKNKKRFEEIGVRVAVMDIDKLDIVNNKGKLLTELKKFGFVTPEFFIAETWDEVESSAKKLGYPNKSFCIKGVMGNGSRAIRRIVPYSEMAKDFFENKPNGMICSYSDIKGILENRYPWPCEMMVMEYLPGDEYAVDILAYEGAIKAIVVRKSQDIFSSNQMQCIIDKNMEIESKCAQVVSMLKLSGNIGFDLKEDCHGVAQIMEINPRFTGGIVACCAAGVNLPYMGILSWLGEPFEVPEIKYGVRMVRRLEELFFDANDNIMEF